MEYLIIAQYGISEQDRVFFQNNKSTGFIVLFDTWLIKVQDNIFLENGV